MLLTSGAEHATGRSPALEKYEEGLLEHISVDTVPKAITRIRVIKRSIILFLVHDLTFDAFINGANAYIKIRTLILASTAITTTENHAVYGELKK
jgi:hypothetical protein